MSEANELVLTDRLELPDSDGIITHVAGKQLEKPIPFKKGENLWLKVMDFLPSDGMNEWELSWYEF